MTGKEEQKLSKVFRLLVDFLEGESLDYAVVGAFALHAFGYVRATQDVDFLVRSKNQEKIIRYLEMSLGYETIHRSAGFSNHVHPLSGLGRVDFLYVQGATADAMFGQSSRLQVFGDFRLPVVKPEHLVALKVFAMANNPERALREMADIKELLDRLELDLEEVRGYFEKHGQLERYYEIVGKDRKR
jgi:hypothetical protein